MQIYLLNRLGFRISFVAKLAKGDRGDRKHLVIDIYSRNPDVNHGFICKDHLFSGESRSLPSENWDEDVQITVDTSRLKVRTKIEMDDRSDARLITLKLLNGTHTSG